MGTRAELSIIVVSIFWAFIGIVCPIFVQCCMRKSPNKGIVQIMFIMTAVCCYLFWLCAFLFQLNPLVGPQLESNLIRIMQYEWFELIQPATILIRKSKWQVILYSINKSRIKCNQEIHVNFNQPHQKMQEQSSNLLNRKK